MPRTEDSLSDRPGASVIGALPRLKRGSETGLSRRPEDIPISDRLAAVVRTIRQTLKCEAVGIRLIDEDGNATYRVQDGFPMNHGTAVSNSAMKNSITNRATNSPLAWRAKCQ